MFGSAFLIKIYYYFYSKFREFSTRKMQSVQTEGRCSLVGATVWRLEVLMTALHGDYQI
jgi:hypothetical protein